MKAILKFTVVMAFMFTTVLSMAKEPKLYIAAGRDAKSLVFSMETQSDGTSIKFVDAKNNLIYSERIADANGYTKRFDMSKLAEGKYIFEMEDAVRVIQYTIEVEATNMEIIEKTERTKPYFRRKGDRIYLNLLNLDKGGVQVKVYDGDNRLIYKELFTGELVVEKVFNFERAFEDNYTVVVKDSNDTYYEAVIVE
ncbi:hypothetical protein WIW50_17030 [Flavobacteriaceae bacterium 3-367]|uniref:hypothetical protein n=1 Tax=Eudoraea algarum TaxID=3417568 RepID=UPI00326D7BA1